MAKNPAPQKRSSLTPLYAILGIIALVGVGALVSQAIGGGSAAMEPVEVAIDPAELARVQGIAIGPENAPVEIYEFADFQCPGCGQFAAFVAPLIKDRLVGEGLVRFVYYDFPLIQIHRNAFVAARAGRCANAQSRFWEYHDLLYGRQPTWSAMGDPTGYFVDLAGEVGVDARAFEECLRSDQFAEEVTRSLRLGESLGVNGTPTLFVNGKRLAQTPSFSELEQIVREEVGAAAGAPADVSTPVAPPAGS